MTWTTNPTDTVFLEDERILLRVFATNITTMTAGTATLQFNAAAAATGDSFWQLAENVTFKAEEVTGGWGQLLNGKRNVRVIA